jgi:hypothetical protein
VVSPTYTPDAIALIHNMTGTKEKRIDNPIMTRMTINPNPMMLVSI